MKNIICQKCDLRWDMSIIYSYGIKKEPFCPYCGTVQKKQSADFTNTKEKMERELQNHRNGSHFSCTDDYSYWWGVINTLDKKNLFKDGEYRKLMDLKDEFEEYGRNVN